MTIRTSFFNFRWLRRLFRRRPSRQSTRYATAANEMAGRNLRSALRPRGQRQEAETIASCLESCFPVPDDDDASQRLRDAMARLSGDGKPPRS